MGELPLSWIFWLIYSSLLAAKVALILSPIIDDVDIDRVFRESPMLTTAFNLIIGLTGNILLLAVSTQHDAPRASKSQLFVKKLTHGAMMDIWDTAALLTYSNASKVTLPLVVIITISLVLPTVPLVVLSRTRFGRDKMTKGLRIVQTLLYRFSVNTPLLVYRLGTITDGGVSVFIFKNLLGKNLHKYL